MGLYGTIELRRSVRKFKQQPVPRDVILKVLEAVVWAPSAHNAQPWRFVVVEDLDVKRCLADSMGEAWESDLAKDGVPLELRRKVIGASVERFIRSPAMIVACLTMEDMQSYPDERRQNAEYLMAVQSVAAAIQNLLLALQAERLGACWLCAPLFCQDVVRRVLGIPNNVEPQALIIFGYPDEEPTPPPRFPIERVVHFDRWRD